MPVAGAAIPASGATTQTSGVPAPAKTSGAINTQKPFLGGAENAAPVVTPNTTPTPVIRGQNYDAGNPRYAMPGFRRTARPVSRRRRTLRTGTTLSGNDRLSTAARRLSAGAVQRLSAGARQRGFRRAAASDRTARYAHGVCPGLDGHARRDAGRRAATTGRGPAGAHCRPKRHRQRNRNRSLHVRRGRELRSWPYRPDRDRRAQLRSLRRAAKLGRRLGRPRVPRRRPGIPVGSHAGHPSAALHAQLHRALFAGHEPELQPKRVLLHPRLLRLQ